jgi:hypothetical protein
VLLLFFTNFIKENNMSILDFLKKEESVNPTDFDPINYINQIDYVGERLESYFMAENELIVLSQMGWLSYHIRDISKKLVLIEAELIKGYRNSKGMELKEQYQRVLNDLNQMYDSMLGSISFEEIPQFVGNDEPKHYRNWGKDVISELEKSSLY